MPSPSPSNAPELLAIVGIACRFPGGADSPVRFWELLTSGTNAITVVPSDRWDADRFYAADPAVCGRMVTRWGGFVKNLDQFDAGFFSLSPREATRMDPQQRWLLELARESFEDAHCPPSQLKGSDTGVFIGLSNSDYGTIQHSYRERLDGYTNSGNSLSIASNRISFQFDLKGPSLTLDTACSSGLVAVDLACESIWSGRCGAALAGASNAIILPDGSLGFSKAGMLSPTGKCHAFDARADGYVRSEGAGMLFIKPLSQALADGNPVYSVIRSSIVNQDGRTSSMTVPGLEAQREMTASSLARAGVEPSRIVYVEAHGTGTPVGDPIEARALGDVLAVGRGEGDECLLGSVKTNIGHLETASGIAGLIKAALVLKHGEIPPSLHFEKPNPNIPFDELNLRVVTATTTLPLPAGGSPLVLVNSFGFGGTNAQVVLEGPPPVREKAAPTLPPERLLLLPLSARSGPALKEMARQFSEGIGRSREEAASWCVTAATALDSLEEGLVVTGRDGAALSSALSRWLDDPASAEGVVSGPFRKNAEREPVFVFTGQGPQWWGMARGFLANEPVFRDSVEKIDTILRPHLSLSLLEEMGRDEEDSRIHETAIAQPALFALQAGLVELWRSLGVTPSLVIGHSVGEVAAAYAAGIYTLESASELVYHRSRLQATTSGQGRMAAVGMAAEEARRRIHPTGGRIELAVINSPSLVTLAGDTAPLEEFIAALAAEGKFVRWLPINYAFHTRQMNPIRGELLAALGNLRPAAATVPFFSTVTGSLLAGPELDATYWWRNVRETVHFGPAIEQLVVAGRRLFLEIGPHPSLASSIRECLGVQNGAGTVLHSLRRGEDDSLELAKNIAGLHLAGVPVDWRACLGTAPDPELRLPACPWQRKTFWNESPISQRQRVAPLTHPLLGFPVDGPMPAWELLLDPRSFPYLDDHRFWNRIVLPGAAFAGIALAVGREQYGEAFFSVEDLVLERALIFSGNLPPTLRTEFDEEDGTFRLYSRTADSDRWTRHARGRIVPQPGEQRPLSIDLSELRARLPQHLAHWDFYESYREAGYRFGPAFRLIEQVRFTEKEALTEVNVPAELVGDPEAYLFHPTLLDACFQSLRSVISSPQDAGGKGNLLLPAGFRSLTLHATPLPPRFRVHARVTGFEGPRAISDLDVYDPPGNLLASIRGFQLDPVRGDLKQRGTDEFFYEFTSEPSGAPTDPVKWATQPCLVLADSGGFGETLARSITAAGGEASSLPAGADAEISDYLSGKSGLLTILHLGYLDAPEEKDLSADTLTHSQECGVFSTLALARALREYQGKVRLLTILPARNRDGDPRLAASTHFGFQRVAAGELPGTSWTSLVIDPQAPGAVEIILSELERSDHENEVVYRGGERFCRRLRRIRSDELTASSRPVRRPDGTIRPWRIESESPGQLDRIVINETVSRALLPGEIEVRVAAAGINFRDLMKALAVYPGDPAEQRALGDDFAGTITRVGSAVTDLRPGDEVFGIADHAFQSHVVTERRLVLPMPASMPFPEAATMPTVFLTAHYAIHHLARLHTGESILIHAAAGGVGLAAVQIARQIGLEIFATAGTEEKRDYLRRLGVTRVFDSRSLGFADTILELTGGRGVDAVLNSLAGEFISRSLSVLAPFGRFLEIGKVDIYRNRKLGLHALRNNISYHVIDMAQYLKTRTMNSFELMLEFGEAVDAGRYEPLPAQAFSADSVTSAMRLMSQGKHLGKLVLDCSGDDHVAGPVSEDGNLFPPDRTFLVAGGMSGFGFETAKWLASNGARHLALLSRTGPADESIERALEELAAAGVTVRDLRADLTDAEAVARALSEMEATMPPPGGVIHAAMVLEDRFINELDVTSFEKALHPKMLGAWNLHESTRHLDLEFFVCYSSFAAVVGSSRQANYNAGNTFLDELCHYRQSLGLPALSINWGALTGAGFADRNQKTLEYLERTGASAFTMEEALSVLGKLMRCCHPQVMAAQVDWNTLGRLAPSIGTSPLYKEVAESGRDSLRSGQARTFILAAPPEQQRALVEDFLTGQVAAVFGAEESALDRNLPVTKLGLDSLMAIELLNRIENELAIRFPMGSILNGPSISSLAGPVLETLQSPDQGGGNDLPENEDNA